MGMIQLLDQKTVDQIAAGEVVERPSSVVKELVENAVDAGADAISIEIRDGGSSLIRITDNGCGIAPEDVRTAFVPHATSKIREIKDLDTLSTLGFRGEALASIASVSRVELITKTEDEMTAVRYRIEGGTEFAREEIGAPEGTTLIVRDLFYNVPVRAKFLKTAMTESGYIGSYVEQLALSHPSIAFTYKVSGNVRLSTSGTGRLKDVIYAIYGREVIRHLVSVDYLNSENGISVHGYIAKPVISRGNRHFENYYVNGRYVKNNMVSRAIEDGFSNRLMNHQYPFACLFLEIQGDRVDVNVHPTKMEVRFTDESAVYEAVKKAVDDSLKNLEMINTVPLAEPVKKDKPQVVHHAPEPFEKEERRRAADKLQEITSVISTTGAAEDKPLKDERSDTGPVSDNIPAENAVSGLSETIGILASDRERRKTGEAVTIETAAETDNNAKTTATSMTSPFSDKTDMVCEQAEFGFLKQEARPHIHIIGQVFRTYWLMQYEDSLFIIDQHAAHEKVLYERLIRSYEERQMSSQMISPPFIVTLSSEETALFETYKEAFTSLGFEISHFGGHDYAVSAVPYAINRLGSERLFKEILDHLDETRSLGDLEVYTHRVATEACKAAVKGHDILNMSEAEKLVDELMTLEDPYHCPHGRPTIIAFTEKELEKKFKRIL